MTRQYIDDYLAAHRIETNNLLEVSTMDLLIEFSKISLGVACVIRQFVEKELAEGELVEIPLPFPIHRRNIGLLIWIIYSKPRLFGNLLNFTILNRGLP